MGCVLIRIPLEQLRGSLKKESVLMELIHYRLKLEHELDEWLRRSGEGYCDGGGVGPFDCEIFIQADSPRTVIHGIRRILNERHLFDATISFQQSVAM